MGDILKFDNVLNVRDFGGQGLLSGQGKTYLGKLYRGAQISKMSPSDSQKFSDFDISLIIDFRYRTERNRQPSRFEGEYNPQILELLAAHEPETEEGLAPHEAFILHDLNSVQDARNYMLGSYGERPHYPAFTELASRTLKTMAAEGSVIYVHCAAGKDRTGTFVAILLMLLGVSDADVMEDYMRTRQAVDFNVIKQMAAQKMQERYGRPYDPEALEPFFGVYPEFLQRSLEKIGDVESYVKSVLGLTKGEISNLRNHYIG